MKNRFDSYIRLCKGPDSPSSKKEGVSFENLFEGFSTEERHFLNRVLEENKLIPQEIIPYTVLSER